MKLDNGWMSSKVGNDGELIPQRNHVKQKLSIKAHVQLCTMQWRSQNAEKVTHIKGRLLDQAVIQFNGVPFHNGTSLKGMK